MDYSAIFTGISATFPVYRQISVQFVQPLPSHHRVFILAPIAPHRITVKKRKIIRQKDDGETKTFSTCKRLRMWHLATYSYISIIPLGKSHASQSGNLSRPTTNSLLIRSFIPFRNATERPTWLNSQPTAASDNSAHRWNWLGEARNARSHRLNLCLLTLVSRD